MSFSNLHAMAHTSNPFMVVVTPLLAGVTVHLSVRPFEIDLHTPKFVFAYLIALTALVLDSHLSSGQTLAESLLRATAIAISFNIGLFGSILVYRAFFHRLDHFPGPLPAKLTRFHALKISALTSQKHLAIDRAHDEYGDFVRVGIYIQNFHYFAVHSPTRHWTLRQIFRTTRDFYQTGISRWCHLRPSFQVLSFDTI